MKFRVDLFKEVIVLAFDTVRTNKMPSGLTVLGIVIGITAIVVSYPPGGKSGPHHHAGSVLAYVLSGAIRSENSATGPARVYKAGESFFEPPGSRHLVSENASANEPASLLGAGEETTYGGPPRTGSPPSLTL